MPLHHVISSATSSLGGKKRKKWQEEIQQEEGEQEEGGRKEHREKEDISGEKDGIYSTSSSSSQPTTSTSTTTITLSSGGEEPPVNDGESSWNTGSSRQERGGQLIPQHRHHHLLEDEDEIGLDNDILELRKIMKEERLRGRDVADDTHEVDEDKLSNSEVRKSETDPSSQQETHREVSEEQQEHVKDGEDAEQDNKKKKRKIYEWMDSSDEEFISSSEDDEQDEEEINLIQTSKIQLNREKSDSTTNYTRDKNSTSTDSLAEGQLHGVVNALHTPLLTNNNITNNTNNSISSTTTNSCSNGSTGGGSSSGTNSSSSSSNSNSGGEGVVSLPTITSAGSNVYSDVHCVCVSNISWDGTLQELKNWIDDFPVDPPLKVLKIVQHPQACLIPPPPPPPGPPPAASYAVHYPSSPSPASVPPSGVRVCSTGGGMTLFHKTDHTGRAFVEFDSFETVTRALRLNDASFMGRPLKIVKAYRRGDNFFMLDTTAHYRYYHQLHDSTRIAKTQRTVAKVDGGYNWGR